MIAENMTTMKTAAAAGASIHAATLNPGRSGRSAGCEAASTINNVVMYARPPPLSSTSIASRLPARGSVKNTVQA